MGAWNPEHRSFVAQRPAGAENGQEIIVDGRRYLVAPLELRAGTPGNAGFAKAGVEAKQYGDVAGAGEEQKAPPDSNRI